MSVALLPFRARRAVYSCLAPATTGAVACAYRDAGGEAWRAAVERDFGVDVPAEEAAARYRELCGFRVVNGLQFRLCVQREDGGVAWRLDATKRGPWAVVLAVKNVSDEPIVVLRRGAMSEYLGVRRLSDGFEVVARGAPKPPQKKKRMEKVKSSRLAPGAGFKSRMRVALEVADHMGMAWKFRPEDWRGGPDFDCTVDIARLHLIPATRGDFELFLRLPGIDEEGNWQGEYEGRLPVAWGAGAGE